MTCKKGTHDLFAVFNLAVLLVRPLQEVYINKVS